VDGGEQQRVPAGLHVAEMVLHRRHPVRRDRCGSAFTSASGSGRVAGRIFFTRRALPPPRTRQGLAAITSSATAVFMMVRSDVLLPKRPAPTDPGFGDWYATRKNLTELMQLEVGTYQRLQTAILILIPLVSAALSLAIPKNG